MVQEYRKHLGLTGRTWIVNDTDPDASGSPALAVVLERGSPTPVAQYVYNDLYERLEDLKEIPDDCRGLTLALTLNPTLALILALILTLSLT